MTKKFFGSKKVLVRKCWICKGPNPPRQNDHMYCEMCLTKRCCVCRKIKLFQVRLVDIEGMERAICPRHYGSFQRFRSPEATGGLQDKWLADKEFREFIDKTRLDRAHEEMIRKQAAGEVVQNPDVDYDAVIEAMLNSSGVKSKE